MSLGHKHLATAPVKAVCRRFFKAKTVDPQYHYPYVLRT